MKVRRRRRKKTDVNEDIYLAAKNYLDEQVAKYTWEKLRNDKPRQRDWDTLLGNLSKHSTACYHIMNHANAQDTSLQLQTFSQQIQTKAAFIEAITNKPAEFINMTMQPEWVTIIGLCPKPLLTEMTMTALYTVSGTFSKSPDHIVSWARAMSYNFLWLEGDQPHYCLGALSMTGAFGLQEHLVLALGDIMFRMPDAKKAAEHIVLLDKALPKRPTLATAKAASGSTPH